MVNITQGGLANSAGNTLEQAVIGTLTSKGFNLVRFREYKKNPAKFGDELLLHNVPYTTIYGHKGNSEFLLTSKKYGRRIRIECKWQQSPGSVDEKFPYLYLNCIEAMPEKEIIIIIDGGGAKPGAVNWLKEAAAGKFYTSEQNRQKKVMVMNLAEFLAWANKTFR